MKNIFILSLLFLCLSSIYAQELRKGKYLEEYQCKSSKNGECETTLFIRFPKKIDWHSSDSKIVSDKVVYNKTYNNSFNYAELIFYKYIQPENPLNDCKLIWETGVSAEKVRSLQVAVRNSDLLPIKSVQLKHLRNEENRHKSTTVDLLFDFNYKDGKRSTAHLNCKSLNPYITLENLEEVFQDIELYHLFPEELLEKMKSAGLTKYKYGEIDNSKRLEDIRPVSLKSQDALLPTTSR